MVEFGGVLQDILYFGFTFAWWYTSFLGFDEHLLGKKIVCHTSFVLFREYLWEKFIYTTFACTCASGVCVIIITIIIIMVTFCNWYFPMYINLKQRSSLLGKNFLPSALCLNSTDADYVKGVSQAEERPYKFIYMQFHLIGSQFALYNY